MHETLIGRFEALIEAGMVSEGQPLSLFWSRADGRLHVQWYRAGCDVAFSPHTHSEFNIVVPLEGAVETLQMGGGETVEPGEAMMGSNPGVEHSSRYLTASAGSHAVSLTFAPEVPGEILGRRFHLEDDAAHQAVYLGRIASPVVAVAAREIAAEMERRALGYEAVIEGLATRILVETLRLWPAGRRERVESDTTPRLSRRDHIRGFEFMRWCRKDAFRIQHLCRFLGTSEERFSRLFRAATNDSPASFYNRLLLEQGCDLLRDSAEPVKEISYALGFKTPSHFVAAFRRQYGRTPQEYRLASAAEARS
jgi:AraC-like DNA-binding protein